MPRLVGRPIYILHPVPASLASVEGAGRLAAFEVTIRQVQPRSGRSDLDVYALAKSSYDSGASLVLY